MSDLSTRNLHLSYGSKSIIEDLSIDLASGGIISLIGPNGSGKSTFLKSLARLLPPDRGSVLLDGKDIQKLPTRQVAQKLAILPQSPTAPEGLTVEELVWFGRHPHQKLLGGKNKEDQELVQWALAQTGMTIFAKTPLENLSGGQRQRAWIAMSLAQGTGLLLLDEPTTYLDLSHQLEVLHLLQRLNKDQKKTILMVLHDLNQATRYSSQIVVVRDGKVYAQGDPADIITHELLQEVFGLKAHIIPDPDTGKPHIIPYGIARMF